MLSPTQLTTVFALLVLVATNQPACADFDRLVDLFEQKMETLADIANETAHHLLEAHINRTERRHEMLNDLLKIVFQYSLNMPNATLRRTAYGKKKRAGDDQDYDLVLSKTIPASTYVVRSGSSKVRRSKHDVSLSPSDDVTEGIHKAHYHAAEVTLAQDGVSYEGDESVSAKFFGAEEGSTTPSEKPESNEPPPSSLATNINGQIVIIATMVFAMLGINVL